MPARPSPVPAHVGDLAALVHPRASGEPVVELSKVHRVDATGTVTAVKVPRRRGRPWTTVAIRELPDGARVLLADGRTVPVDLVLAVYAARVPDARTPDTVPPMPSLAATRAVVTQVAVEENQRARARLEEQLPHMGRA